MRIREGVSEDAETLDRIRRDSIEYSTDKSQFVYDDSSLEALMRSRKEFITEFITDDECSVYVCHEADEVVGFGMISLHDNTINALFVKPDYMGQGIGSKILDKLENDVPEDEIIEVYSSKEAADFYDIMGYKRLGEAELVSDRGNKIPCVFMAKGANPIILRP